MASAVKQFSIGGTMAIVIGLVATALQWKYPEYKWAADGLLIFAGLIAFATVIAAIVRFLTIREYERQATAFAKAPEPTSQHLTQQAQVNPVIAPIFAPHFGQIQSQAQSPVVAERITRDPVFECRGARLRHYGFNMATGQLIREQYEGDQDQLLPEIRFVDVALARFLYRPDPGVDPRLRVNAHVFIYRDNREPTYGQLTPAGLRTLFSNRESRDIYKPIWDDDEPHVSMEFSAGYTHELIVALIPTGENPQGIIGYEHGTKFVPDDLGGQRVFCPEIHDVAGQTFIVKVELIPKLHNEVRCVLPSFWFQLALASLPQPVFAFLATVEP